MAQHWLSEPWWDDPWAASFDQLRRNMDELFERFGAGTQPLRRAAATFPPVNLYDASDAYVLTAELPGLEGKDVDVSIEGNRVTLRGERAVQHPEDASIHRAERRSGSFRRTVELPLDVDADKAEAVHRHGVLMLRIPKSEANRPRRIDVRGS